MELELRELVNRQRTEEPEELRATTMRKDAAREPEKEARSQERDPLLYLKLGCAPWPEVSLINSLFFQFFSVIGAC